MNKRLRKKLHKKEFQEMGFYVSWDFYPAYRDKEDEVLDDFIEKVESLGLSCGGGGGKVGPFELFVCRYKGSCTEADRQEILKWCYKMWLVEGKVINTCVGNLVDAWYGRKK